MRLLRIRWLLTLLLAGVVLAAGGLLMHKERLAERFLADGRRRVALGQHRSALGDFTLAILLASHREHPYHARAEAYQSLRMPDEALADLDAAIALAPERADLHFPRGLLLLGPLRRPRDAVHAFDVVLRLQPEHGLAYYHRGEAYDQINNSQQAVKDFSRAIELRPDLADAYVARAYLYGRFRRHAEERADLDAALRLQPGTFQLWVRRAEASLALRDYAAARADLDRVLAVRPSPQAFYKRGAVNLKLRNERAAVADFTSALELNRTSIAVRYDRALAYDALGERQPARRDFAIVCELQAAGQSDACQRARER